MNCCSQEHKRNGDLSTTDDDSLNLLHDLHASQSRGVVKNINKNEKIHYLDLQVGNKEQEKKVDMEICQLKPLDSGIFSCIPPEAGKAEFTSQSGNCMF